MAVKVLDLREHSFPGDKGEDVKGFFLYLKSEDTGKTKRCFVGEDRMADMAYIPKQGDTVEVFYNDEHRLVDILKA